MILQSWRASLISAVLPLSLLACQATAETAANEDSVTIYHRIVPYGSSSATSWRKRGSLRVQDGPAHWTDTSSEALADLEADEGELYQIGIATSKPSVLDGSVEVTNFVSVPECYLYTQDGKAAIDQIRLNVLPASTQIQAQRVTHISYAIPGVDVTRCPTGKRAKSFNTIVKLAYPETIDPPRLHRPVVVKYEQDGTVKEPEPEKSFIQKYWMYIVPAVVLLITSGSGGEEAAPADRR